MRRHESMAAGEMPQHSLRRRPHAPATSSSSTSLANSLAGVVVVVVFVLAVGSLDDKLLLLLHVLALA